MQEVDVGAKDAFRKPCVPVINKLTGRPQLSLQGSSRIPLHNTATTQVCLSETRNPSVLLRLIEKARCLLRFGMGVCVCAFSRIRGCRHSTLGLESTCRNLAPVQKTALRGVWQLALQRHCYLREIRQNDSLSKCLGVCGPQLAMLSIYRMVFATSHHTAPSAARSSLSPSRPPR